MRMAESGRARALVKIREIGRIRAWMKLARCLLISVRSALMA